VYPACTALHLAEVVAGWDLMSVEDLTLAMASVRVAREIEASPPYWDYLQGVAESADMLKLHWEADRKLHLLLLQ
jgi:hypothetical protein